MGADVGNRSLADCNTILKDKKDDEDDDFLKWHLTDYMCVRSVRE